MSKDLPPKESDNRSLLEYSKGVHITDTGLWLDAKAPKKLSFVSHAHSDHVAKHESIIATKATVRFYREKVGNNNTLEVPYRQPFYLGELLLELFPAGHILGAAQIMISLPASKGGITIGYTGDFSTGRSSAEKHAEQLKCDILVMEATFGKPHYAFPEKEEVFNDLWATVTEMLNNGLTPVIMAYQLGKSQEVIKFLGEKGCTIRAHKAIWDYCRIYQELGVSFSNLQKLEGEAGRGEVLVVPHNVDRCRIKKTAPASKFIAVTGWALDKSTKFRLGVDEMFPLSDHADFNGLLSYALASEAKKIYVMHGFVEEFVHALREKGVDASPMVPPRQLELALQ